MYLPSIQAVDDRIKILAAVKQTAPPYGQLKNFLDYRSNQLSNHILF
jgi:hypothetical protein